MVNDWEGQPFSDRKPVSTNSRSDKYQLLWYASIIDELRGQQGDDARAFTELSLKKGHLLILLDGLDEVPTANTNHVIEQIEAFVRKYQKNAFVASCRTAAYHSSFKQFSDVTIADFDDEQIEQFIRRWFNSKLDQEADTANQYWQELQQPQNDAAKELAQTPLLLTFLCLVYEREQTLPSKRSTLYERALNILLSEWSAQKRLERAPIYKDFHPDLEKVLLSEIAYTSFKEDRLFFSKSDIINRITGYLADTLDAPEHLDGAAVLNAIEVQQGILVERATNAYSFSHLTLQEYLTARYLTKKNLIQELVSQHLTDERWREVFLLVSGLLEERSQELWLAMEQQANTFVSSSKLQGLLQWVTELSNESLPSNQLLAAKAWLLADAIAIDSTRAFNSTRAINSVNASASAIVSASAVDYDALSKKLEELENQMPSDKATYNEWQSFADQLRDTLLTFLHLDRELITFSLEEALALGNYLTATKLIIDCKNAAVRVSRKEWEAIESRLLTVKGPEDQEA